MTWFNILFCAVFTIFFLKTIISWVGGDVEVDLDLDGEIDSDIGSILSFKGILHFLMGFSTVLTSVGYSNTHSFVASYTFSTSTYIFAVCFGIFIMVMLFYLYKIMNKLNHYSSDNINLDDMTAKIYVDNGEIKFDDTVSKQYEVLVNTPSGTFKKTAYSSNLNFRIGDEVTLKWDNENNRYII